MAGGDPESEIGHGTPSGSGRTREYSTPAWDPWLATPRKRRCRSVTRPASPASTNSKFPRQEPEKAAGRARPGRDGPGVRGVASDLELHALLRAKHSNGVPAAASWPRRPRTRSRGRGDGCPGTRGRGRCGLRDFTPLTEPCRHLSATTQVGWATSRAYGTATGTLLGLRISHHSSAIPSEGDPLAALSHSSQPPGWRSNRRTMPRIGS